MHQVFESVNPRMFASDNASAVHPKVMAALQAANGGHVPSYGDDPYTRAAQKAFDEAFECPVGVAFVYNGTGANCVALSAMAKSYHGVVCTDCAHIYTDECGAPEHLTGAKLLAMPNHQGKLRPGDLAPHLTQLGNMHHSQARVVSLTQCTEMGTVYTLDEIRAIADLAHAHGLYVHMDGARIANAAASLRVSLADMTWRAGVDMLSFGATKNGLMFGEAVVAFGPALAKDLVFVRKNNGQLASKMRFIAAQYLALLSDGLWLESAAQANAMASRLAKGLSQLPGVKLTYPVEANELFVQLPKSAIEPLMKTSFFYVWDEAAGIIRLVTSWDTQQGDADELLEALKGLLSHD